jgi:hypothetical protein
VASSDRIKISIPFLLVIEKESERKKWSVNLNMSPAK